MPKLVNKSPRNVIIVLRPEGKTHAVTRVMLTPLTLTTIKIDDWKRMKNLPLVQKMLDKGELVEGAAASRDSVDPGQIMEELKNDLNEDELQSLAG